MKWRNIIGCIVAYIVLYVLYKTMGIEVAILSGLTMNYIAIIDINEN